MRRLLLATVAVAFLAPQPIRAQEGYSPDRQVVETAKQAATSTLHAVAEMLRGLSARHASEPFTELADRLGPSSLNTARTAPSDLDDVLEALEDIRESLEHLQDRLADQDAFAEAAQIEDILGHVERARRSVREMEPAGKPESQWLRPGEYDEDGRRGDRDDHDRADRRGEDWWKESDDDDRDDDGWKDRSDWWERLEEHREERRASRIKQYPPAFVSEFDRWPFLEAGTYRPVPSVRYNRVDGLVLGVRRQPMSWDSYDRARVFGQVGYAFALDAWRYEAGAETRLGRPYGDQRFDLKVGGSYRVQTGTEDGWKASSVENSVAAFFVNTDFFDYYEIEGYSVFASARLTPAAQVTVAYRAEDYRTLERETSWSLFGGDNFRTNPAIREGRMQSVVIAMDAGRLEGNRFDPSGVGLRAEVELGQGLGGDFDFNRYTLDLRSYARTGADTGIQLRLRGSTADGDLPIQKQYTLGGAGSLRAYPQNAFRGTQTLLGNAEIRLYDAGIFDDLFDEITLFGLFDAGWTDGGVERDFSFEDVLADAGFGLGLSDNTARVEIAWPLRDIGTGMQPTVWLRLSPTF